MTLMLGGWYLDDERRRQHLPVAMNPSDSDVSRILGMLREKSGLAGIRKLDIVAGDFRPYEIAVIAQAGQYAPILRQQTETGEHLARTRRNDLSPTGLVVLLGDAYPASAVVEDFDLVVRVFQEFASSGDVTHTPMPRFDGSAHNA